MGLRQEKGWNFKLSELWFKIRENMLYSDIQDIKCGVGTLSKKGFIQKAYMAEINSSYNAEENITIMNLLIKQKQDIILMRRKHRKQIHDLNVKYNISRGTWEEDPHKSIFTIPKFA